jgi:mRNA interferase HigB
MKIISKTKLTKFSGAHPESERRLNNWAETVEHNSASNLHELKLTFRRADYVPKEFTVFDVGGNLYRIVTIVHYDIQQLHVLHVFTHEEYDKWTKNNRGK